MGNPSSIIHGPSPSCWWQAGGSALLIAAGLGITGGQETAVFHHPLRIIEAVLPLTFAFQAAFVLPPDGEPALELLNTYRRRLPGIALERLLVALLLQCAVGLAATAIGIVLFGAGPVAAGILRWLPPTLFFGGLIFLTVQLTRQGVMGALITILLWGGLFFGGDAALLRWPSLQPLHAFLQPERVSPSGYAQNRAALTLIGLLSTGAGLWLLRDEERVLGFRPKRPFSFWLMRAPLYGLATAVVLWLGSMGLWVDKQVRRTEAPVCCLTPAALGFSYESITLTSADDVVLNGWYIPSQNGAAVILLHGYGGHRALMLPQAQALAQAGYGVLLYDLRGHSQSGGDQRTFGWADVADVETAVHFLQYQPDIDPARIGIYGFSIGGQIALRAAAQLDSVQGVVADGPGFAQADDLPPVQSISERLSHLSTQVMMRGLAWRLGMHVETAVIDQIDQIAPRPLLLIAAGPPDGLEQRIANHFYAHAAEPKAIWAITNAKHGTGIAQEPAAYASRLVEFFDQALVSTSLSRLRWIKKGRRQKEEGRKMAFLILPSAFFLLP